MRLPKALFVGYNLLKRSRTAVKKNNDDDALSYFKKILNAAQPSSPEDLLLHRFVKGMYNENKYKFLSFIKNTSYECLVLWTESKAIVNALGLRGVIYIKWSGKDTLYQINAFQSVGGEPVQSAKSYEHPIILKRRDRKKDIEIKQTELVEEKLIAPILKRLESRATPIGQWGDLENDGEDEDENENDDGNEDGNEDGNDSNTSL